MVKIQVYHLTCTYLHFHLVRRQQTMSHIGYQRYSNLGTNQVNKYKTSTNSLHSIVSEHSGCMFNAYHSDILVPVKIQRDYT